MKERPVLFSTPMVKAIQLGCKTQTRRIIKLRDGSMPDDESISYEISLDNNGEMVQGKPDKVMDFSKTYPYWQELQCPYGEVGDVLWVREEHYRYGHWEHDNSKKRKTGRQHWKFVPDTNEVRYYDNAPDDFRKGRHHKDPYTPAWHKRLARFMPKSACRLFLRITNRDIGRLQDISEADAIAEGVLIDDEGMQCYNYVKKRFGNMLNPQQSFETLWQSINGEQSWNDNPWVWVIDFERIANHK